MIAAIDNDGNTLLLTIPYKSMDLIEDVNDHLGSIGIQKTPDELPITNDGAAVTIKLIAESNMDKRLLSLISSEDTLATVNTACSFLAETPQEIKDEIQRSIDRGAYQTMQDMMSDAQTMCDKQEQVIRVTLRSEYLYTLFEDDYVLTLPKTAEQLCAARDRLGVKNFGDCEIIQIDSPLHVLANSKYHGDIMLMNDIARAAAKAMKQDNSSILLAILEAHKNADAYDLKEYIEHLNCYELQPNTERYDNAFFRPQSANYADKEMLERPGVQSTAAGWLLPRKGSLKIYVPLTGREEYNEAEVDANELALYRQEIAAQLDYDVKNHLQPMGLIADSMLPDSIKNKVLSVIPTVEVRNKKLWGCLQIAKLGWIPESELSLLSDECFRQLKFGWGNDFRTQDIRCSDCSLQIDFWNESDDYRFFSEKEMTELERQTGQLENSSQEEANGLVQSM